MNPPKFIDRISVIKQLKIYIINLIFELSIKSTPPYLKAKESEKLVLFIKMVA